MDDQTPTAPVPLVVGADGTPRGRAAARDAADLAVLDGVTLHIVAAYKVADDIDHRMARIHAPRDVVHDITARGDAFADAHEARLTVAREGLDVQVHVVQGSLSHGVATVARKVGGAVVLPEQPKRPRFARLRRTLGEGVTPTPVVLLSEGGTRRWANL